MNIIETNWKWTGSLSKRPKTNYIVLHHAAAVTCTAAQIDSWHKGNGWSGIGYHFFIRRDGSIYRGRPEWATGAHASGKNSESIGVCVEGNYEIETTMSKSQREAVKEVLKYLKSKYPNATIKGHREVGATGCPGKYYPLSEMKEFYKNATISSTIKEESEDLTMSQYEELTKKIAEQQAEIDELKKKTTPFIYAYIDDNSAKIAEDANDALQAAMNKGILKGTDGPEGLNLTEDLIRIHIWNYRMGLYD